MRRTGKVSWPDRDCEHYSSGQSDTTGSGTKGWCDQCRPDCLCLKLQLPPMNTIWVSINHSLATLDKNTTLSLSTSTRTLKCNCEFYTFSKPYSLFWVHCGGSFGSTSPCRSIRPTLEATSMAKDPTEHRATSGTLQYLATVTGNKMAMTPLAHAQSSASSVM